MKTLLETAYLLKKELDFCSNLEKLTIEQKEKLKKLFGEFIISVNSEPYIPNKIISTTRKYYYEELEKCLAKEEEVIIHPPTEPEIQKTTQIKEEIVSIKETKDEESIVIKEEVIKPARKTTAKKK